jgi:hypothetical protein
MYHLPMQGSANEPSAHDPSANDPSAHTGICPCRDLPMIHLPIQGSACCEACDSPVTMDSSTAEVPDTTSPSAGSEAPGTTRTTSPTCSISSGAGHASITSTYRTVATTCTRYLRDLPLPHVCAVFPTARWSAVQLCGLLTRHQFNGSGDVKRWLRVIGLAAFFR